MSEHLEIVVRGKVVHLCPTGTLHKADYEELTPIIDSVVAEHGGVRLLFDTRGLAGWTPAAMWEDFKIGMHHLKDIERVAFVSDGGWHDAIAKAAGLFIKGATRVFTPEGMDEATSWIASD